MWLAVAVDDRKNKINRHKMNALPLSTQNGLQEDDERRIDEIYEWFNRN